MTKMKKAELTLRIDIVGVDLDDFNWDRLTAEVFTNIAPPLQDWGVLGDTTYILRMVDLQEIEK